MNYQEMGEKAFFNLLKEMGIRQTIEDGVKGLEMKLKPNETANLAHALMAIQANLFVVSFEMTLSLYGDGNNEYLIIQKYEEAMIGTLKKSANMLREAVLDDGIVIKKQTVKE